MIRRSFLAVIPALLAAPGRLFAGPGPRCAECGRAATHIVVDTIVIEPTPIGWLRQCGLGHRFSCPAHLRLRYRRYLGGQVGQIEMVRDIRTGESVAIPFVGPESDLWDLDEYEVTEAEFEEMRAGLRPWPVRVPSA